MGVAWQQVWQACATLITEDRDEALAAGGELRMRQATALIDRTAATNALQGLDTLLAEGGFDDEFVRPTEYAIDAACALITAAYSREPQINHLRPLFSATGDGSLYLRWKSGEREARVLIPPADSIPVRLYYREAGEDGVEACVTPDLLAQRLNWLAGK